MKDYLVKLETEISKVAEKLKLLNYNVEKVSADELYIYLTCDTPTGDTTTLDDVLSNEYLMIHEVVEVSELKKMNVPINERTIMEYYPEVYEAHLTAVDYELTYALINKDYEWIKRRLSYAFIFSPAEGYQHLQLKLTHKVRPILEKFSRDLR
ncbi:MAG: hypothetical protein B7O98_00640 [Zestosphaera tikiterensis]|uniref:Uncharacterized protein n=1 Tax=Zestosphaera tikiterensis TaxID=1973259 RepID=A0A2R7Y9G5_9CREN|nr:MAG: hypothetical protein B7O98_00640 [Zestosphaera tikiterensis]